MIASATDGIRATLVTRDVPVIRIAQDLAILLRPRLPARALDTLLRPRPQALATVVITSINR